MKFEVCFGYDDIDNFLKKYPAFKNYNLEVVRNVEDFYDDCFITINSLDELLQLSKSIGYDLVIGHERTICVCDGYCD